MPRKQYQYHYIYRTTNLINQKYYVGMHSTNDLNDGYMGSGDRITRSIRKYGKENFKFEILEYLETRELLKQREREIINEELLDDKLCMNLVYGGGGGYISPEGVKKGRKKSDQILEKKYGKNFRKIISENYYNSLTPLEREILTEKIKEGLRNSNYDFGSSFRGKTHTDKAKRIIGEKSSINQKGKKNSQFGTCWLTNGLINIKVYKKDIHLYSEWTRGRTLKKQDDIA
jgi:group I intron endonuclease